MTLCNKHGCGRPIRWAKSRATGKSAPLDPEPSDDGNIILDQDPRYYIVLGSPDLRDQARVRKTPLYTNHFSTCPAILKEREAAKEKAREFRKEGAPSPYSEEGS